MNRQMKHRIHGSFVWVQIIVPKLSAQGGGMTDRELMQQALDVIIAAIKSGDWKVDGACDPDFVINALRTALAQPEPEPVAWGVPNTRPTEKAQFMMLLHSPDGCQYPEQLVPLYTAPPQREWQGLTEEEYEAMAEQYVTNCYFDTLEYAKAIEIKLKDKNEKR
jgi:hypothetical protein